MTDGGLSDTRTDRELLEEAIERVRRLEASRTRLELALWILVALAVLVLIGAVAVGAIATRALMMTAELAESLGAS